MHKNSIYTLYFITLAALLVGCSEDRIHNEMSQAVEDDSVNDYDLLWSDLVKECTDLQGEVYRGDKLQVLALKQCFKSNNANIIKTYGRYEWEILVYYRNVSAGKIKIPLSPGGKVDVRTSFPEIIVYSSGLKEATWYIPSKSYFDHDLIGSVREYDFVELLPGEVAVSNKLFYSFESFKELKKLNEDVYLEIKCETLNQDHWNGSARIRLPITSKKDLDFLK